MTEIKICGLVSETDAAAVNECLPEYAGMVMFYEKSKRNISVEQAKKIIGLLDKKIKKTAVVVSTDISRTEKIEEAGFDYIQVHGKLSDEVLESVKIPVIRAVNIGEQGFCGDQSEELDKALKNDKIYGVLFDAGTPGSGKTFSWQIIKEQAERIKKAGKIFFLAGGLNPENVAEAVREVCPDAVDVSSGVENESGFGKDLKKIEEFIRKARSASSR